MVALKLQKNIELTPTKVSNGEEVTMSYKLPFLLSEEWEEICFQGLMVETSQFQIRFFEYHTDENKISKVVDLCKFTVRCNVTDQRIPVFGQLKKDKLTNVLIPNIMIILPEVNLSYESRRSFIKPKSYDNYIELKGIPDISLDTTYYGIGTFSVVDEHENIDEVVNAEDDDEDVFFPEF